MKKEQRWLKLKQFKLKKNSQANILTKKGRYICLAPKKVFTNA